MLNQTSKTMENSTRAGRGLAQREVGLVVETLSSGDRGPFLHDVVDHGEKRFNAEGFSQIISGPENEQPLDLTWSGVSANDNDGNARGRRILFQTLEYF